MQIYVQVSLLTQPHGALVKVTELNLCGLMLNHKHRRYCLWFLVWLLEGWKALQQGWNWEKQIKGRGSENIPVISNSHLLALLTKFWEVSKCPFSCFDLCFCRCSFTECHWGLLSWGDNSSLSWELEPDSFSLSMEMVLSRSWCSVSDSSDKALVVLLCTLPAKGCPLCSFHWRVPFPLPSRFFPSHVRKAPWLLGEGKSLQICVLFWDSPTVWLN